MGDSKQLVAMAIDEVSGVDRPANQLPGWVLQKMENALEVLSKREKTMTENVELTAEERGLFTKFIDFLRKSDAPKEGEVTTEEHEAALEAVRAEQADAVKKAVDEALAARDEELKKAADEAEAEAERVAAEAKAAEDAKAGEGTEEVAYAKAEDVDAIRKELGEVTEVLDKITDALTAVLEKSARKTSLDAPAADQDGKVKKTVSGLFDSAIKNPGKVVTMTGGR